MDAKLKKCSWIIHLLALAHAASSLILDRLGLSDEIVLSLLTISTIVLVCYVYGLPLDVSAAIAALCCFAAFYLGTLGGRWLLASGVPFLVAYASEITTFLVTEIMGWITVIIANKR